MTTDAATAPTAGSRQRGTLRRLATVFVTSVLVLWLVVAVMPGISAEGDASVVAATVVVAVVSAVVRPVLALVAAPLGWLGVVAAGLGAQALVFYAALSLTPGMSVTGFWPAFWASWLYALLVGVADWTLDADDDDIFARDVMRQVSFGHKIPASTSPGVVIVQIDGLPAPLLRWAVQSGELPTLSRWLRSGGHRLLAWRAQLPATTPASQAGILHGRSDAVPAFRWYEKETGRLTVTNHPADAAYVEANMSDGRGLLADGGVSIGNLFSGDAPSSLLTMSSSPRGAGPSRAFAATYLRPFGFARSVVLSLAEMLKELHQSHRQVARDIQPRINRRTSYVGLRAVTNVLLRDLNVRLIAEHMARGAPVVYCDFTDYDEVAHHAGPSRPESLASLAGVDRAIGVLERVAAKAPRPYRFVVLSDHGQSQGATFRQRYGETVADVVRRLAHPSVGLDPAPVAEASTNDEQWGRVDRLLDTLSRRHGPVARLARHVVHRHGHDESQSQSQSPDGPEVVVAASGNLALVYFPRHPRRVDMEDVERDYPQLLSGLARHPGIGFAVVRSRQHGAVALGPRGAHYLDEHRVEGVDPLQQFGSSAAAEVRRHAHLAHTGDIVLNSQLDGVTGEVAAFEELVGCHGGLGGWQSEAVLVHPAEWVAPPELVGADAVHRQLVRWLSDLGLRRHDVSDEGARTLPQPV